ncbi:MAG: hypothetical protein A2075_17265 [Geobacteraceae bacterium GWC2_58_44]|nr:MAG: hypothetical protein A2075_17265 [Geobacteraceae bacterium GWC2_58_44]HBG06481.1 hypothetical protein [Geobacter sp.]
MINITRFLLGRCIGVFLWAAVVLWCSIGVAAEPVTSGGGALVAKYPSIRAHLERNQFGAPIYLESTEAEGSLRVDMYGIFNHPFDAVKEALHTPTNWCEIALLHINIKACTSKKTADQWLLTLYSGRKYYQLPGDAYPLKLNFRIASEQPDFLDLTLVADEGPLRTKDHRIRLQAVPLDQGRTLVHFSYTYRHGSVARMAIKSYFATLGRDKVGFTIISRKGGKPVYIDGVRGAVERNTVRYYLALHTYMDTLKYPEGQRFEQRISRWYDLTAKYPRQLKETEKGEYLANKRQERKNQIMMQKKEG